MNEVCLVVLFWNGAPFYRYVTSEEPGAANAEAGAIIDRLTDSYSGTFNYHVDAIAFRRSIDGGRIIEAATDAFERAPFKRLHSPAFWRYWPAG